MADLHWVHLLRVICVSRLTHASCFTVVLDLPERELQGAASVRVQEDRQDSLPTRGPARHVLQQHVDHLQLLQYLVGARAPCVALGLLRLIVLFLQVLLYPLGVPLFFYSLLRMNKHQLGQNRIKAQLGTADRARAGAFSSSCSLSQ